MSLNQFSDVADAIASYQANAAYEEEADTAKAAAFITACRHLLLLQPKRTKHGGGSGEELEFDPTIVKGALEDAQRWLRNQAGGELAGSVIYADLQDFRE